MILSCKVLICPKRSKHDWTECPYAHPGEKARRRDLRFMKYQSKLCPELDTIGTCSKGEACPYSHNLFESYLHPERYRTVLCSSGSSCTRKLCFFAHSIDQLRQPKSAVLYAGHTETSVLASAPPAAAAAGGASVSSGAITSATTLQLHQQQGSLLNGTCGSNSSSSRSATPQALSAATVVDGLSIVGQEQQQQQQQNPLMLQMMSKLINEVNISKQQAAGAAARAAAANAQAAAIKAELDAMKAAAAAAAGGGHRAAAAGGVSVSAPTYVSVSNPPALLCRSDQLQWSDLMMKQQQQQQQPDQPVSFAGQTGPLLGSQQVISSFSDNVITHVTPGFGSNAVAATAPLRLVPVFTQQSLGANWQQQQQQQQKQVPMQAVVVHAPAAAAAAVPGGVAMLAAPPATSGQAVLSRPLTSGALTIEALNPMLSSSNCFVPGMLSAEHLHASLLSTISTNNNITGNVTMSGSMWPTHIAPQHVSSLHMSAPHLISSSGMPTQSMHATAAAAAAAGVAAGDGSLMDSSGVGVTLLRDVSVDTAGFWSLAQAQNGLMR